MSSSAITDVAEEDLAVISGTRTTLHKLRNHLITHCGHTPDCSFADVEAGEIQHVCEQCFPCDPHEKRCPIVQRTDIDRFRELDVETARKNGLTSCSFCFEDPPTDDLVAVTPCGNTYHEPEDVFSETRNAADTT